MTGIGRWGVQDRRLAAALDAARAWRDDSMLGNVLHQRGRNQDDVVPGFWVEHVRYIGLAVSERAVFPRLWRLLHVVKFLVCVVLRRRRPYLWKPKWSLSWRGTWLELATWDHRTSWGPDGTMYDWRYAAVAVGLRDWFYCTGWDGAP